MEMFVLKKPWQKTVSYDNVYAKNSANIESEQDDIIQALNNISIQAENLNINTTLTSGVNAEGVVNSSTIDVDVNDTIINDGFIVSGGDINLPNNGSFNNYTSTGDGDIKSYSNLGINFFNTLENFGIIESIGTLTLSNNGSQAEELKNNGTGVLLSSGKMQLSAKTMTNGGHIKSENDIDFDYTNQLTNSGIIENYGNITIDNDSSRAEIFNNTNVTLLSYDDITLSVSSFDNTGGKLLSAGIAEIDINADYTTQEYFYVQKALRIIAKNITNNINIEIEGSIKLSATGTFINNTNKKIKSSNLVSISSTLNFNNKSESSSELDIILSTQTNFYNETNSFGVLF